MDFEAIMLIGKAIAALGSIFGAIRYVPKWYRWVRSWTIVKRAEFDRLKQVETKHQQCGNRADISHARTKDQEFSWLDFLWLLKEPFWQNYNNLSPGQAGDTFLETAIHGPLCPDCKRELSSPLSRGKSDCLCSKKFSLGSFAGREFPVLPLRRAAYTEAQAAVRRGELKQSGCGMTQIGDRNPSASDVIVGDDAGVVVVGQGNTVNQGSIAAKESEIPFVMLETQLAELFEMRADLQKSPFIREFVLLGKQWSYNADPNNPIFHYYFEDHPNLKGKLSTLENYGLIKDARFNKVDRFRFTEDFVNYLRKQSV